MARTLFELKNDLATVGQQIQKVDDELAEKAIATGTTTEELQALEKTRENLEARFKVIKNQHDVMEAEQRRNFEARQTAMENGIGSIEDPNARVTKAKAELIRATMRKQQASAEVFAALGDNNTSGGNKFLPKTVSTSILTEPFVKNPLRQLSTVTQITNLEIPKLIFTLDDDDFIADTATAKELEATGDTVTFGRKKFKVFAGVSETVLQGSDANLVATVELALQSGVAAKEKKVAFTSTPKAGEEHMSFYSAGVTEVTDATLFDAIDAALADLHEDYHENAKIVMRRRDYTRMVKTLANGNATLFAVPPEQILGKPVIFCDSAVNPIVGDFSYSHFNYDLDALYETQKDIKTGIEQFVVTAWFDHQIKLKSAFRIAKVAPAV